MRRMANELYSEGNSEKRRKGRERDPKRRRKQQVTKEEEEEEGEEDIQRDEKRTPDKDKEELGNTELNYTCEKNTSVEIN